MSAARDIIIKTYGDQLTLWVSEGFVREQLGVSATYMKESARSAYNKRGKSWRYNRIRGAFYYDYDSIPKSPSQLL